MRFPGSGTPFVLVLLAAGCSSSGLIPDALADRAAGAGAEWQRARRQAGEAGGPIAAYPWEQRSTLADRLNRDLARMRAELAGMSAEVESSRDEAKKEAARDELQAVRGRWTHTKRQLDDSGAASEARWSDVKSDLGHSYGELERSFEQARSRVSEEPAF